jgi:hypothetical protein
MGGRRTAFWLGVAGVALLTDFLAELAALKVGDKAPGVARFVQFAHRGNG